MISGTSPPPGIYPDVSYDDYAAWDAMRGSILEHMGSCPAMLRYVQLHGTRDTRSTRRGRFSHTLCLEPELAEAQYVVKPKFSGKGAVAARAEWEAEHADCDIVAEDDRDNALRMRDAIMAHQEARAIIWDEPGRNELSVVWDDPATGERCKCRTDRVTDRGIINLKTDADPSPAAFSRKIFNLGYHRKAGWALWGADVLAPRERQHLFVVVQNQAPHLVAVYHLAAAGARAGSETMREWLALYHECRLADTWPSYPTQQIDVPVWAQKQEMRDD